MDFTLSQEHCSRFEPQRLKLHNITRILKEGALGQKAKREGGF